MPRIRSVSLQLLTFTALLTLPGCVDAGSDDSIDEDRLVELQSGGEKLASINLDHEADVVFAKLDNGSIVIAGLVSKTASADTQAKLASIDLNDIAGSYAALAQNPDVFAVERLEKTQREARPKVNGPVASFTDTSTAPRLSKNNFNNTFCGAPPAGWDIRCTERGSSGTFASVSSSGKQIYMSIAERNNGSGNFDHEIETRWCSLRVLGLCVGVILTITQVEQSVPDTAYSTLLLYPPVDDSVQTRVTGNSSLSYLIAAHILSN